MGGVGGEFPEFLSTLLPLRELKYLKDYATLEWLQHLSYCAPLPYYLEPNELQNVPEEFIDNIQFLFHPSVFFLKSNYPLDNIYELLEEPTSKISGIDLNSGISYTIINRVDNYVKTLWVPKDYFEFLTILSKGKPLNEAITETLKDNPKFEFVEALRFILSKKLISLIKIPVDVKCL